MGEDEVGVHSTIGKGMIGKLGNDTVKSFDEYRESSSGERRNHEAPPGIAVSLFDYSVDNHFRAIDAISKLCGEPDYEYDQGEIQRLCSSITFLREWRNFCYQPRTVRFACHGEASQEKDITGRIILPQFSSATVPTKHGPDVNNKSLELSKDFILYVGGVVWALDWCPRVQQKSESDITSEFIAVAAHPPTSSYHKIGAPLSGRGVIQIWCLLSNVDDSDLSSQTKKNAKGNSWSTKASNLEPKRPRGRPRKKPIHVAEDNLADEQSSENPEQVTKESSTEASSRQVSENSVPTASTFRRMEGKSGAQGQLFEGSNLLPHGDVISTRSLRTRGKANVGSTMDVVNSDSFETNFDRHSIPNDIALPRLVLCLAHNGKVAWDVKWRPSDSDMKLKHTLGYLAVLLGTGSLEVWEVPLPSATKSIYSCCEKEGADPRFVKLEPIFRCSMLKCGDRQSIPLTVEWSASSPHDLILAGCHDGVVALWKFSANAPAKDTRPLLCFNADKDPIRALAWAPPQSDPESANVIATAGHKGLKFWDIRDPFRPLWDFDIERRIIYSLDWLPDPRCILLSADDGTLKILGLSKAAYDVPVTGKPFGGTPTQGLHDYYCSLFTIWSVQVSRATGMVAYCTAEGSVLCFQLTLREVEKDPLRNRAPHFLCGSVSEEDSILTVISPLSDDPFSMNKLLKQRGNAPRTKRGFISLSQQSKSAKEKTGQLSEEKTLAICYNNDPESYHLDDTMMAEQETSTKSKSKKKMKPDQASRSGNEDSGIKEESGNEDEMEGFPPKAVAMHKVRWNMNKGSERWLCFGGAAGIVRCQWVDP